MGGDGPHDGPRNSSLGLATFRPSGFAGIGLASSASTGTLTTTTLTAAGGRLVLTADLAAGSVMPVSRSCVRRSCNETVQLKAGASFTSPVFSPGDSPASLAAPPQSQQPLPQSQQTQAEPELLADDGGVSAEAFEAVRAQLAQQTERIEQVVDEVTRLESEKGQWMELYAQSEIEFSTMVARSSTEAAREVALDCEAYAARVQVNWITAAGRRRELASSERR